MKRIAAVVFMLVVALILGGTAFADGPCVSPEGKLFIFPNLPADAAHKSGATAIFVDAKWGEIETKDPGNGASVYDLKAFAEQPSMQAWKVKICRIDFTCKWADPLKSREPARYWKLADKFIQKVIAEANGVGVTRFYVEIEQENPASSIGPTAQSIEPLKHIYAAAKAASKDNIVIAACLYGTGGNSASILYRTGAKDFFDVAAFSAIVNPDNQDTDAYKIAEAHAIMAANGDEGKKILLVAPASNLESAYRAMLTERDIYSPDWVIGAVFTGKPAEAFPPKVPECKLEAQLAADAPTFNYVTGKTYALSLTFTNLTGDEVKLETPKITWRSDKDLKIDVKPGNAPVSIAAGQNAASDFKVTFPSNAAGKQVTLIGEVKYLIKGVEHTADCWFTASVVSNYEITLLPARMIMDNPREDKRIGMSVINHSDALFNGKINLTSSPGIDVSPKNIDCRIDPYGLEAYVFNVGALAKTAPGHYAVFVDVAGQSKDWAAIDVPYIAKKITGMVDGKGGDWKDAKVVSIAQPITGADGKLTYKFIGKGRFAYDDKNFYALIEADDTDGAKPKNAMIAFDPLFDGALSGGGGYKPDDFECSSTDTGKPWTCAISQETGKTFYEFAVPWTEFGSFKPGKGGMFSLSAMVTMSDGKSDTSVEWGGGIVGKKDPRKFVPLILSE